MEREPIAARTLTACVTFVRDERERLGSQDRNGRRPRTAGTPRRHAASCCKARLRRRLDLAPGGWRPTDRPGASDRSRPSGRAVRFRLFVNRNVIRNIAGHRERSPSGTRLATSAHQGPSDVRTVGARARRWPETPRPGFNVHGRRCVVTVRIRRIRTSAAHPALVCAFGRDTEASAPNASRSGTSSTTKPARPRAPHRRGRRRKIDIARIESDDVRSTTAADVPFTGTPAASSPPRDRSDVIAANASAVAPRKIASPTRTLPAWPSSEEHADHEHGERPKRTQTTAI